MLLLGIMQFALIAVICIYELKKKSPVMFLWAVLLVMFAIPHMISTLVGNPEYTELTLNEASLFVILFSGLYLIIRILFHKYLFKDNIEQKNDEIEETKISKEKNNIEKNFLNILFIILIGSVLLRIINLVYEAGGISNITWETMFKSDKGYFSLAQIFMPFFMASSASILLSIKLKNKKILFGSIIIVLIEVLLSKNRIEILPILVGIIYGYILNIKKVDIKKILILGFFGVFSIYLIYALRVFRHAGSIENFVEKYDIISFNETVIEYFKNDDGELSLRNYMYYFIENDNNFENFGKGHTYLRMALVLIPTKWSFGIKPPDFAKTMGRAILPDSPWFSIHPTLFGDAYANFGFYGILVGIFWAIFACVTDKLLSKTNKTLNLSISFALAVSYVIQGRGSVYNAFIWSLYSSIIILILYFGIIFIKNGKLKKCIKKYLIKKEK